MCHLQQGQRVAAGALDQTVHDRRRGSRGVCRPPSSPVARAGRAPAAPPAIAAVSTRCARRTRARLRHGRAAGRRTAAPPPTPGRPTAGRRLAPAAASARRPRPAPTGSRRRPGTGPRVSRPAPSPAPMRGHRTEPTGCRPAGRAPGSPAPARLRDRGRSRTPPRVPTGTETRWAICSAAFSSVVLPIPASPSTTRMPPTPPRAAASSDCRRVSSSAATHDPSRVLGELLPTRAIAHGRDGTRAACCSGSLLWGISPTRAIPGAGIVKDKERRPGRQRCGQREGSSRGLPRAPPGRGGCTTRSCTCTRTCTRTRGGNPADGHGARPRPNPFPAKSLRVLSAKGHETSG